MLDSQPNVIEVNSRLSMLEDVFDVDYFTYPRTLSGMNSGTLTLGSAKTTHLASMDFNGSNGVSEHRAFVVNAAQNYPVMDSNYRMRETYLQFDTPVSYPTLHAVIRLYAGDV